MVAQVDHGPSEGAVAMKGYISQCERRLSGETPVRDNRTDSAKSTKAMQIFEFLHSIKASTGTNKEQSDIPKEVRQEDLGIECVLSTLTTDSRRVNDCITSSKMFKTKQRARGQLLQTIEDELPSIKSEKEPPKNEKKNKQQPSVRRQSLSSQEFDADERSVISKWSEAGSIEALLNLMEHDEDDDPWRAAKRGDINALKEFDATRRIDWAGEDDFHNIPLYYACHSGAIVDINVVSFLLKVTPIKDPRVIDRCRKNAINPDVVKVLNGMRRVVDRAPERAPDSSRDEPPDDGSVSGFSFSGFFSLQEKQEKKNKYERVPVGQAGSKDWADLPPMRGLRKVLSFDKTKRKEVKDRQEPTTKERTKTARASELPPRSKKPTREGHSMNEKDEERARNEEPKLHRSPRRRNSMTKQYLDDSVVGSSMPDIPGNASDSRSLGSRASELSPHPKKPTREGHSKKERDEETARNEEPKSHRSPRRRNSMTKQYLDDSVAGSSIPDIPSDVSDSRSLGARASDLPPFPPPKKPTRESQSEKERGEERARGEKPKLRRSSRRRNSVTKQFLDDSVAGSSMPDILGDVGDSWSLGSLSFMGRRKKKTDRDGNDKYSPQNSRSDAIEDTHEDSSSVSRAKTTRSDTKKSQAKKARPAPKTIEEDWSVVSDVTSQHTPHQGKSIKTSDSTIEDSTPETKMSPSSQVKGKQKRKGDKNAPIVEFIEKEKKWVIANQTTSGTSEFEKVILTIHVFDILQHVYIRNCHGVSIQIHGKKANAILIDSCSRVNVVFGSVVGTCEVVNSKKVALETIGVCPTFALDKTNGITVWLSKESMQVSSFVTSKCTEVNISIPEGGDDDCDRKEVPLPEQFVHKFQYGEVKSVASFDAW